MRTHNYQGGGRRRRKRQRFSQASTRRPITLYDQHSREWTAQVGIKTGMPTGSITPNFSAPWYPDQQFLRVNAENTSELFIDYKPMLLRRRARMSDYHKGVTDWCNDKKVAPPEKLGEYTEQMRRGYGAAPKPIQPIVAAMQGNKYILGLTTKVDTRLERFIVKPRNEQILDEFDFHDEEEEEEEESEAKKERRAARAARAAVLTPRRDFEPLVEDSDVEAFDNLSGKGKEGDDEEFSDEAIDELLSDLEDEEEKDTLDETFDAEARGGRRVPLQQEEKAERQAPRRPAAKTTKKNGGKSKLSAQKKRQIGNRKTLADGAAPVIAD